MSPMVKEMLWAGWAPLNAISAVYHWLDGGLSGRWAFIIVILSVMFIWERFDRVQLDAAAIRKGGSHD